MSSAGKTARAGVAAFALGLSLVGPHTLATASADPGDSGSVVAPGGPGSSAEPAKADASRAGAPVARRAPRTAAAQAAQTAKESQDAPAAAAPDTPRSGPARPARSARSAGSDSRAAATRSATPAVPTAAGPAPSVPSVPVAAVDAVAAGRTASVLTDLPTAVVDGAARAAAPALAVAGVPTGNAAATGDIFSTIFGPIQSLFEGIALLVRRTFFNQAPTVNPVQTTGQLAGPITGTLGAFDPEGDPLTYDVTDLPQHGLVTVGPDGGFVYTPGPDFTGRDSFNVAVTDGGFHINLLDPFRPSSTEAYTQVAQNAVQAMLTFSFSYGSGSQYWSASARNALESAAEQLATYFVVTSPTAITYTVTASSDPQSSTLASAGSDLSDTGAGFFATVVQKKIQTGVDANGVRPDGEIDWNFGNPWAYGASVSGSQYDFTSTAMHELLHSFGFLSYTDEAGNNTGREWTTFDQFIVTADGTPVISNSTYRFNTAYNKNLTGGSGGLFFSGPNAVAAYGALVPIYTPNPWEPGSSTSHLDDETFTGSNTQLMNAVTDTGPGVRVLSPVELGILKDLGYTVTTSPMFFMFIGFGFLRRRDRRRLTNAR